MRKIVASFFLSLDGVSEAPQTWHFPYLNDELGQAVGAQMAESDTMLMGRRTYEEFAAAFADADPSNEMAAQMTETPKYVVSTTLDALDWKNSTLIKDDVAGQVARLKEQPGKNISMSGSAVLVRSLLRDGLIDELCLLVHPVVVGSGARLFEDIGAQVPLALASSQTFSTGVLSLVYTPAAP
jgi:dihydrofolate reductase